VKDKLIILHQALIEKVEHQLSHEQLIWLRQSDIIFNKSLRTSLGRAIFLENRIELNPTLLAEYPDELEPTFAHELAHLIAPILYGRSGCGHQIGWQKVMHDFGYSPQRTHRLPVGCLKRTHAVAAKAKCGCVGFAHEIKPRRYRKMRYGRQRYRCLKCKQELQLML